MQSTIIITHKMRNGSQINMPIIIFIQGLFQAHPRLNRKTNFVTREDIQ